MKLKIKEIIVLALAFSLGYATASLYPLISTGDGSFVAQSDLSVDARLPVAARLAGATAPDAVADVGALPGKQSEEEATLLVQRDLGYRCATPTGVCALRYPQPLGSFCSCTDGSEGSTVR